MVVLVVGLAVFAYAGPALVVREVTVTGVSVTRVAAVRQAAGIVPGRPLAQVDVGAIDDRVRDLPFVAQVRVSRHLPGTVRVDVVPRQAAALVPVAGGGYRIVDAGGVPFARAAKPLRGVPVIKVSLAESARPALQAALAVLAALPEPVRAKVGAVTASTPDDVRFTVGPATVVWGSVERSDRKAAIYAALRRTPAKVYDLSSPDTPVLR